MCVLSVCVLVLSLPCCLFTKCRGLTFTSARVLVRAPIDGPGSQPIDVQDRTLRVVRALMPTLAAQPPHVCHGQKDWAVSTSSHMLQDVWHFYGVSASGRFHFLFRQLTTETWIRNVGKIFFQRKLISMISVSTRVSRPARRHVLSFQSNDKESLSRQTNTRTHALRPVPDPTGNRKEKEMRSTCCQ